MKSTLLKLLSNFWVLKEKDVESYYECKNIDKELKDFIVSKLGLKFYVTSDMVRLEKVPLVPREYMGILDFEEPKDYVFFCLVLAFLEDKGKDTQFLLEDITQYIRSNFPGEEIDWTMYSDRRSLIRVLKFCEKMGLIKIDDGNQELFVERVDVDVLYESTGLSKYFMRTFPKSLVEYSSVEEILNSEFEFTNGLSDQITDIKRIKAYRGLLIDGIVDFKSEVPLYYIKKQKTTILQDLEKFVPELELHLFKSFAYLSVEGDYKYTYPDDSNLCDVLLLCSRELLERFEKGELRLSPAHDILEISLDHFKLIVEDVKKNYGHFWNKEWREKSTEKIFEELLEYLQLHNFAQTNDDGYLVISPILFRIVGEYQDYETNSQLSEKDNSNEKAFEDINVDGGFHFEDEQGK
uniref:TIGR02678 family protein n=1 Tax=Caldicellulosiruptor owensensis TaxID=55205 RepID=A0A7C5V4W7_9FIRM